MKKCSAILAALIAATFMFSAEAATKKPRKPIVVVTAQQVQSVEVGQTKDEVIAKLGLPNSTPKWRNGTHSLVYQTNDGSSRNTQFYVDIDNQTGKVIRTVVMPDDNAGGDSGDDSGGAN